MSEYIVPFSQLEHFAPETWQVMLHLARCAPKNKGHTYVPAIAKGQLISKCLFGVIVWTKNQRKNFQNFCSIEAKTEILVIFSLVFCPNDDTKKTY